MKSKRIAYLVVTGLFCLAIVPGAIGDLVQPQMVVDIVAQLQIPLAMLTLIGIWKLLGVIALARPSWRRLNEWAYAGFFFDLTGAAVIHGAAEDYAGIVPPLVLCTLLVASYVLRDRWRAASESPNV